MLGIGFRWECVGGVGYRFRCEWVQDFLGIDLDGSGCDVLGVDLDGSGWG